MQTRKATAGSKIGGPLMLLPAHDRLLDDEHLMTGLGAAYSASDSMTVHVVAVRSLTGSITHRDIGMAVGTTSHSGSR